ncbi:MAG: EamA family transporter [Alphaproteobacteria bacterium]|nr:EamA family transporter [Alphaproteobacteria bacterium]MBL7096594.1 EamA family transporter [Alphaproteobacteria bacterium]
MTSRSAHLSLPHVLLAVAVMAVWGSNFVVIKMALAHMPPLLFAAMRFALAFFPAALFLKRPAVPWSSLIAYGVLIGGQFAFLYIAMEHSISPGLASLVVQTQVFFTIGLAMAASRERVVSFQWMALGLAAAGLVVIVVNRGGDVSPLGLALVLAAALSWAGGNVVGRAHPPGTNMLAYVVWASLFGVPPLLLLSFVFEGWPAIEAGVRDADWLTWGALLYQSFGNSLFGYGAWAWLMARYPAAVVSPFALLVPVFGMATSAVVMSEPLQSWKLLAAALVMSGLALNLAWPRLRAALA